MGKYFGYFRANDTTSANTAGTLYRVDIISSAVSPDTEILLAGSNPFVVSYNTSETPFDPSRTSTASINIVHNTYLQNVLSPYAQGTRVELHTSGATDTLIWKGYLKPEIMDQGYENDYETIELNASDCLASLQYIDYTLNSGNSKSIVTFENIINRALSAAGLSGYFWTRSKKVGNSYLLPSQLKISEQNFFTSDTDEPWKWSEVIEEMCRYIGFTCLQWEDKLYFIDYQYFHNNNALVCWNGTQYVTLASPVSITANSYMLNGGSISFDNVYNKCSVKCSMYEVEDLIPKIFNEDKLINRYGNKYSVELITQPTSDRGRYIGGSGGMFSSGIDDDAEDSPYNYYRRLWDNENYESVYRAESTLEELSLTTDEKKSWRISRAYLGGTLCSIARIPTTGVSSSLEFSDYLMLKRSRNEQESSRPSTDYKHSLFRLKEGYYNPVILDPSKNFFVFNCKARWTRYLGRDWVNTEWTNTGNYNGEDEHSRIPSLFFKFNVGNKYYNSTSSAQHTIYQWGDTNDFFEIRMAQDDYHHWNEELSITNSVDWSEWSGMEGWMIPVPPEFNSQSNIGFEIGIPSYYQNYYVGSGGREDRQRVAADTRSNYVWLTDLSIKIGTKGTELKEDSDVVFENEIVSGSVNELSDIEVKFTSFCDKVKPSYSHVGYNSGFLTAVTEDCLSSTAQIPEKNIIERYTKQYSVPRKKETLNLNLNFKPFNKIIDTYWNQNFVMLGTEINYKQNKQNITILEIN